MDDSGCKTVLTLHPPLAIIRPRAQPKVLLNLKCTPRQSPEHPRANPCKIRPKRIYLCQQAGKIVLLQKPAVPLAIEQEIRDLRARQIRNQADCAPSDSCECREESWMMACDEVL